MVNVSHDCHDRRTRHRMIAERMNTTRRISARLFAFELDIKSELFNDNFRGLKVEPLIDRRSDAILKQLTN